MGQTLDHAHLCTYDNNVPVSVVYIKSLRKITNCSINTYITFTLFKESLCKAVKKGKLKMPRKGFTQPNICSLEGFRPPKISQEGLSHLNRTSGLIWKIYSELNKNWRTIWSRNVFRVFTRSLKKWVAFSPTTLIRARLIVLPPPKNV